MKATKPRIRVYETKNTITKEGTPGKLWNGGEYTEKESYLIIKMELDGKRTVNYIPLYFSSFEGNYCSITGKYTSTGTTRLTVAGHYICEIESSLGEEVDLLSLPECLEGFPKGARNLKLLFDSLLQFLEEEQDYYDWCNLQEKIQMEEDNE
jgi:hypothetical protein